MIMATPARRLALVAAFLLAACGDGTVADRESPGPIEIGDRWTTETTLTLEPAGGDPVSLEVAIADTDEERQVGLMNVETLPEGAGLVFLHDEPTDGDFWMKDTLIPLSIAVWDEEGIIRDIVDMEPCEMDPCTVYDINATWVGAVEVNQGFFAEHGIEVGSTARLEG